MPRNIPRRSRSHMLSSSARTSPAESRLDERTILYIDVHQSIK
jgi:hypothetical protein